VLVPGPGPVADAAIARRFGTDDSFDKDEDDDNKYDDGEVAIAIDGGSNDMEDELEEDESGERDDCGTAGVDTLSQHAEYEPLSSDSSTS